MDFEYKAVCRALGLKKITTPGEMFFSEGIIGNTKIIAVKTGMGPVKAKWGTQLLISRWKPDRLLNIGIAGAVNRDYRIGQIFIAEDIISEGLSEYDSKVPKSFFAEKHPKEPDLSFAAGRLLTVKRPLGSGERKEYYRRTCRVDAVDMEAWGIAGVSKGIPLTVVKVISDMADESIELTNTWFSRKGKFSLFRLILSGPFKLWKFVKANVKNFEQALDKLEEFTKEFIPLFIKNK